MTIPVTSIKYLKPKPKLELENIQPEKKQASLRRSRKNFLLHKYCSSSSAACTSFSLSYEFLRVRIFWVNFFFIIIAGTFSVNWRNELLANHLFIRKWSFKRKIFCLRNSEWMKSVSETFFGEWVIGGIVYPIVTEVCGKLNHLTFSLHLWCHSSKSENFGRRSEASLCIIDVLDDLS